MLYAYVVGKGLNIHVIISSECLYKAMQHPQYFNVFIQHMCMQQPHTPTHSIPQLPIVCVHMHTKWASTAKECWAVTLPTRWVAFKQVVVCGQTLLACEWDASTCNTPFQLKRTSKLKCSWFNSLWFHILDAMLVNGIVLLFHNKQDVCRITVDQC